MLVAHAGAGAGADAMRVCLHYECACTMDMCVMWVLIHCGCGCVVDTCTDGARVWMHCGFGHGCAVDCAYICV